MNNLKSIVPYAGLQKFAVNNGRDMEAIADPLYSRLTYAAAGVSELTFFQDPRGQGGLTYADTNMAGGGALPAPQSFLVDAISIDLIPSIDPARRGTGAIDPDFIDDIWTLASGKAFLKFQIGEKAQLIQAPLMKFPTPYKLDVEASASTGIVGDEYVVDYATISGMPFRVVPMLIPATQNFNVTLDFGGGIAINNDMDIQINLHGTKYRSVQ